MGLYWSRGYKVMVCTAGCVQPPPNREAQNRREAKTVLKEGLRDQGARTPRKQNDKRSNEQPNHTKPIDQTSLYHD